MEKKKQVPTCTLENQNVIIHGNDQAHEVADYVEQQGIEDAILINAHKGSDSLRELRGLRIALALTSDPRPIVVYSRVSLTHPTFDRNADYQFLAKQKHVGFLDLSRGGLHHLPALIERLRPHCPKPKSPRAKRRIARG